MVKFLVPFFQKSAHFVQYWKLLKFSRLDPAYHPALRSVNGMSIRPRAFAILLNKVINLIFSTSENLIKIMCYVLF